MRRACLLLALAALVPASATAQTRLILGGGLSNPVGDFGDQVDSGFHGRAGLELGFPLFPLSFRGEGEYHRLSEGVGQENANLLTGSLSAVLSLGGIGLSPYVLAGLGQYRYDGSASEAVTNSGFHGGFGVAIGALGFGGFAEIRLVNIDGVASDQRYVPVSVGVKF